MNKRVATISKKTNKMQKSQESNGSASTVEEQVSFAEFAAVEADQNNSKNDPFADFGFPTPGSWMELSSAVDPQVEASLRAFSPFGPVSVAADDFGPPPNPNVFIPFVSDPFATEFVFPSAASVNSSSSIGPTPASVPVNPLPPHIIQRMYDGKNKEQKTTAVVLPGQYYYFVGGLIRAVISWVYPENPGFDISKLSSFGRSQIEQYLATTNLTPPDVLSNSQIADPTNVFFGQTTEFPLWEKRAFVGSPEELKTYEEFLFKMANIIKACAATFCNAQPEVHRQALRLRDLLIAREPSHTTTFRYAQLTCFKSMRITANCAMNPRHLTSRTVPWSVVIVLGTHFDGGQFLISTGEEEMGLSRGRALMNSMESDILVVNNERRVGNSPFGAMAGTSGMFLLELFLPEMGHEFDKT